MDQYVEADEQFGDCAPYDIGPVEFLNLIRLAEYVCTDSFHGTCFSVIHHKKFVVFNRYSDGSITSKNSRIDSLCHNLGLKNRRYSGDIMKIMEDIDYLDVEKKLEVLRKQTDDYLDNALSNL